MTDAELLRTAARVVRTGDLIDQLMPGGDGINLIGEAVVLARGVVRLHDQVARLEATNAALMEMLARVRDAASWETARRLAAEASQQGEGR